MNKTLITVTSLIVIGGFVAVTSAPTAKHTWLVRSTDGVKPFEVVHDFHGKQPGDTVDLPPLGHGLMQMPYPKDKVYVLVKKLD